MAFAVVLTVLIGVDRAREKRSFGRCGTHGFDNEGYENKAFFSLELRELRTMELKSLTMKAVGVFLGLVQLTFLPCEGWCEGTQADMPAGELVFFVAPEGNDSWSGRREAANTQKTDGPFATLARALQEVARSRADAQWATRPVTVYLRGGTYWLDAPVRLGPEHSGQASARVTIAAYRGEKPVLSGGRPVRGWQTVQNGSNVQWIADVPQVRTGDWYFRQLWVNGHRAVRARHPNQGYLRVNAVLGAPDAPWHQGHNEFGIRAGDLTWHETDTDAEVIVMTRWVESRLPLLRVEGDRLVSSKRTVFRLDQGDPYYVEHLRSALDSPGEWYLDRADGKLYYIPRPGEQPADAQAVAPKLAYLVEMRGEPEKKKWIEHIVWRGIIFAHTEWYFPEPAVGGRDVGGFSQAAVGVPAAVQLTGARNCTFENCQFIHLGTYAIHLGQGCRLNSITHCQFRDLGAGGIKIGETTIPAEEYQATYSNHIADCLIQEGGRMFHSAVGIWVGQSNKNHIEHCEISDFYYTGISVGWTWGYGKSAAGENVIEYNHVHHIGKRSDGDGPILSDMGGIYTLGIQQGTVIRNNVWHDIAALRYGGWGIYFDEGSSHIVAENNLVYRTTHGGFHQHYGRDNVVRNNIFAFGRDYQLRAHRAENHRRFRFVNNIVYGESEDWIVGSLDGNYEFNNNIYWRVGGGPIRMGTLSFAEWQAAGQDKDSVLADPQFVDPSACDFRLKDTSPALEKGFRPFSWDTVGPRQNDSSAGNCR
jgi:hypothetical protein